MAKIKNLVGMKFNRLTVLSRAEDYISPKGRRSIRWLCQCDCGNTTILSTTRIVRGVVKSCGCLQRETARNIGYNNFKDLTGQTFGRLTVLKTYRKSNVTYCDCICECGNHCTTRSGDLVAGTTKSCGCLQKELIAKKQTKHGYWGTRLYNIWHSMKLRCYTNTEKYKNYCGRGIIVCEEWKNDFQAFYDWAMQNGYDESTKYGECTLDRIDVNGNYEPSNCRWVDMKEQSNNKRSNRLVCYKNKVSTCSKLAEEFDIPYAVLYHRLKYGWNVEKALNTPVRRKKCQKI